MTQKAMIETSIRNANRDDIPRVREFLQSFIDEGKILPRTLDEIEDWIDHFFIAELDGEIIGCAALEIYSKKLAEIRSLSVSAKAQGSGVGKRLVNACLQLAIEKNIYEVMAISSNDAFFHACGFDYTLPQERRAFFIQTRDEM